MARFGMGMRLAAHIVFHGGTGSLSRHTARLAPQVGGLTRGQLPGARYCALQAGPVSKRAPAACLCANKSPALVRLQQAAGLAHCSRRGVTRAFSADAGAERHLRHSTDARRGELSRRPEACDDVWRDVSVLGAPIWAIVKLSWPHPLPPRARVRRCSHPADARRSHSAFCASSHHTARCKVPFVLLKRDTTRCAVLVLSRRGAVVEPSC